MLTMARVTIKSFAGSNVDLCMMENTCGAEVNLSSIRGQARSIYRMEMSEVHVNAVVQSFFARKIWQAYRLPGASPRGNLQVLLQSQMGCDGH